MIAFHPPLSGAPLAFAISLLLVEVGSLVPRFKRHRAVITMFLVCGCLVSVGLAFISGYQASSEAGELVGQAEQVLATHHMLGRFLLVNSLMLVTFHTLSRYASNGRRFLAALYYIVLCAQVALSVQVGGLGGELVFHYQVGAQPKKYS